MNLSPTLTQVPTTQAVADMLRENRSLQSLNIESNFISSTGLMAVLKAVRENATLTELRVDNQVSIPSPGSLIQLTPRVPPWAAYWAARGPALPSPTLEKQAS